MSLEERLRTHTSSFDGLLSLIPSKYYEDAADGDEQWRKKKQTKEEKRKAKRAKLDPSNQTASQAKEVQDAKEKTKTVIPTKETIKENMEKYNKAEDWVDVEEPKKAGKDKSKTKATKATSNTKPAPKEVSTKETKVNDTKVKDVKAKRAPKEATAKQTPKEKPSKGPNGSATESVTDKVNGKASKVEKPTEELEDEVEETSKDATPDAEKEARLEALRQKLSTKIQSMRAERKAPGTDPKKAPQSRAEILAARQKVKEDRKLKRKRAREEEQENDDENDGFEDVTDQSDVEQDEQDEQDGLLYSKLHFETGEFSSDLKNLTSKKSNTKRDLLGQLNHVKAKRARLLAMDDDKKKSIENASLWSRAMQHAKGEKVRDNEQLLTKAFKRQQQQKRKSEREWNDRRYTVDKGKRDKDKKRTENLQARRDSKKVKGKKPKPVKKPSSGKRAGFEGRLKSK